MQRRNCFIGLSAFAITLLVPTTFVNAVTLSISGKFFTIDGTPTFLNGMSYFANNSISTASFRTQDLDNMVADHINWVRAFAFWVAVSNGENIACMNPNGTVREPYMTRLKTLLTEANNRGIIVEVTMNRDSASAIVPANQSQHIACAQTLANQLLPYRNCYFDVSNERDVGDSRFVSLPDIGAIIDAVHAIDSGRKCTASSVPSSQSDMNNHKVQGHMDFIAPHLCRDASCPAATVGTTNQFVSWMNASGFRIPIHYNEPFRRTYNAFNPVQNDFWEDVTGAKVAEAAGWCLHNGSTNGGAPYRSFSMTDADGRLFAQLDGIEIDAALNIFDRIGSLSADVRRYQDEYTEQMSHVIGRREGFIWSAATNLDAANYLVYGPYIDTVPAGSHRADWRLQVDNNSANNDAVVTLDVFSNGQTLASRVVNRMDFAAPNTFQTFSLNFTSSGQQDLEFRVYWHDHAYTQCDWVQLNLNVGAAQAPFGGTARTIPGTIQAEDYDTGGEGVAYHDLSAGNAGGQYRADNVDIEGTTDTGGGFDVGFIDSGEWLEYTVNVTNTGDHTFKMRVASCCSGGTFTLKMNNNVIASGKAFASTGGWQTWTTILVPAVFLSAGNNQILQVSMDVGGWNFNKIDVSYGGADAIHVDLASTVYQDGMTHIVCCDGNTTGATIGGHNCRKNVTPASDTYMYFGVADIYSFQGSRPNLWITAEYYDTGTGSLNLDYDATSSAYKSAAGPAFANSNTWKTAQWHVTDAYFGNRENGGADYRISRGQATTWYLDTVQTSIAQP